MKRYVGLRASFHTLGCRLNQADSGLLQDAFVDAGFELVPWGTPADVIVVNSCTVTAAAGSKTRKIVRAARRRLPEAFVVLAGCDADVATASWEHESGVDLVVGNAAKNDLISLLPDRLERRSNPVTVVRPPDRGPGFIERGSARFGERTRANLKIQEGCNFFCSYCIVPYARGPARSRSWDDILREARDLIARGHRELVLTGVNIASFADHGRDVADLTAALLALPGEFRLRLSSTEPGPVVTRLIDLMAQEPRLCRFLHLPLQYGEDHILAAMNRRYRVAEYAALAWKAARAVPGVCIGSDIIVGFPGETADLFAACRQTVLELPIHHLHVFAFSPRRGTPAAAMPNQVPGDVASKRAAELTHVGRQKAEMAAKQCVGESLTIVAEMCNDQGLWEGWSDTYMRVEVTDGHDLGEGKLARVIVTEATGPRRVRGALLRG